MITDKMIHEAFVKTIPASHCSQWEDVTPEAKVKYAALAKLLNEAANLGQLCPFCKFYERHAEPIAPNCAIGDVPACIICHGANVASPITELLFEWLKEE